MHDNFFEQGGDSLAILRVHQRLVERAGRQLPVLELFRYPTVHALAERLRNEAEAPRAGQAAGERVHGHRPAVAARRDRLRERRRRDR